MTIQDRKAIRAAADARLQAAAYSPRRLVLISSGVSFGISLLVVALNYILIWQVDANAGGLSGMPLRTALETAASVLQYAQMLLVPFWTMGLNYAMLQVARGRNAEPRSLLEGFRRFGPVLRLMLLESIVYGAVVMVCLYLSSLVWSMVVMVVGDTMNLSSILQAEDPAQMLQIIEGMTDGELIRMALPVLAIFAGLCLVLLLPLSYSFCMANYVVMDQPGTGALAALITSTRIMRGNRWKMFRLEMTFWVYYLALLPVMLLAYADQLLPLLGVAMPVSETVAYFAAYVIYILATLALHGWMLHRIYVTSAVAYDVLLQQPTPMQAQPPVPAKVPWDYPVKKEE